HSSRSGESSPRPVEPRVEEEPTRAETPEPPEASATEPATDAATAAAAAEPSSAEADAPAEADGTAESVASDDAGGRTPPPWQFWRRGKPAKEPKKRKKAPWWELPVLIAVAIAVAVLIKTFLIQPFYIPSESMEKTLHGCPGCSGDRVLVNKL